MPSLLVFYCSVATFTLGRLLQLCSVPQFHACLRFANHLPVYDRSWTFQQSFYGWPQRKKPGPSVQEASSIAILSSIYHPHEFRAASVQRWLSSLTLTYFPYRILDRSCGNHSLLQAFSHTTRVISHFLKVFLTCTITRFIWDGEVESSSTMF